MEYVIKVETDSFEQLNNLINRLGKKNVRVEIKPPETVGFPFINVREPFSIPRVGDVEPTPQKIIYRNTTAPGEEPIQELGTDNVIKMQEINKDEMGTTE